MILMDGCLSHLARKVRRSRRCDFAVAFWGLGAGASLGLLGGGVRPKGAKTRVICNLRLGGTNPDEIRALLGADIAVKHSDVLHAKVYRFDDKAVVGSANASANGLGREGLAAWWNEVGAVVEAAPDLAAIDAWFEETWDAAAEVHEADLQAAAKARAERRPGGARPAEVGGAEVLKDERDIGTSLIDSLLLRPDAVAGRAVHFVCNTSFYGGRLRRRLREIEEETGVHREVYAGWQPPHDAILVDFSWRRAQNDFRFNGLFRSGRRRRPTVVDGTELFEVEEIDWVPPDELAIPLSRKAVEAELARWRDLAGALAPRVPEEWKDGGCCIRLDSLAAFLADRRRHVLNVFDKLGRLHDGDAGLKLSGNWRGPDLWPDVIRVYQVTGGRSVAGGVIAERRKRGDGTVVVAFEPDVDEIDRPWPRDGFRANGCMATPR